MTGGTLLQVAFIVLKVTGLIHWPWAWVLSPGWIGAIVAVVMIVLHIASHGS